MKNCWRSVVAAVIAALALAAAGTASAEGGAEHNPCFIGTPSGIVQGEAINVMAPSGAAAHVCVVHGSSQTEDFPISSCTIGSGGDTVQADRFHLIVTPNGNVILVCTASPNG